MARIPSFLLISDERMKSLTLQDVQSLFTKAKCANCLEEYADWFWRTFQEVRVCQKTSLQDMLESLEAYKRRLGREYDETKSVYVAMEYNKIELQIQELLKMYPNLRRKSKIYMIAWKR